MGAQSAFVLPEPYWLIAEPTPMALGAIFPFDEFFAELAYWDLAAGIRISARRGAAFVFDFGTLPEAAGGFDASDRKSFEKLVQAAQKRVQIIGAFSLCLHSARYSSEGLAGTGFRINPHQLIHMSDRGMFMGGDPSGWPPMVTGGIVSPVPRIGVIPSDSIQAACATLDVLFASPQGRAVSLAALLNEAIVGHNTHDFASALVSAWTVCEALLQARWVQLFERSKQSAVPLSSRRRDFLTGRDFTASIVIENLAIAGELDEGLYSDISAARKARNDWIHKVEPPHPEKSAKAISAAAGLLGAACDYDIPVATSVSLNTF